MLSECKADPKHASHTRPPAWTWCVLVHSCNIAVHPLLWSDSSCPATCSHGKVAHHECGLGTAPLPVQLMAGASCSTTYGGAWEQQPLWRLQSAPVTLHLTSADSVRSSTACVYMYAALQDKSLHKYKLVVPPTMPAAQAKVRLIPPTVLLIDLCCGPQLYAALGVLLPINANLRDIDARQMSSSVITTEASRGSSPEVPPSQGGAVQGIMRHWLACNCSQGPASWHTTCIQHSNLTVI